MPPSTRSFGLSDLALGQLTSKSYICSSCRHIALRQRIANQQSIRLASSSNIPFTEKIRRKIWGTDNPPGLADPYGGPSFLERRRNERALQKQSQLQPTPEEEMAQGQKMQEFAPGEKIRTDSPISARNELEKGGYVPADTWDGLQHLGHKGHWSEMPPTPLDVFSPFIEPRLRKAATPNDFLSAIHQATVEGVTLQQAGFDINTLAKTGPTWSPETLQLITETQVKVSKTGATVELIFPTESTKSIMLEQFLRGQAIQNDLVRREQALEEGAYEEAVEMENRPGGTLPSEFDPSILSVPEHDAEILKQQREEFELDSQRSPDMASVSPFYQVADQGFLDMSLDFNDKTTYYIFKRITQLTALRIPDPVLSKATTLRSLYIYQLEAIKPKPKNLAETLSMTEEVAALPNIKIMDRRESPIDKDKAVGRWKVIEAELRSRGLPVLGTQET